MLRWLTPPRNDASLVFENGKFLQSYGKGLGGAPITIGYDSKNQQYFGFTNKGSSNSGSIFEAISASSNGKYSADILRGVVQPIPVADTTPPKPPSQPTPQPKPLSQSELSAAQFLVDTLTADKRQLQAKENEYHRNILQIAKQNMHDSAVKKFARDAALMQQAYAIGGEMGLDYDPRAKKFIEENPGTALALAAAPYVGMGVGLLGEIGFSAAARLLPTIAAEGGGGSSLFSGSRFANAFFMNESAGATAATATRFSASTTAVLPNPNFVIGTSAIAAAVALKATNDDNIKELWNQFANPTTLTPTQPVKIWDVNKPCPKFNPDYVYIDPSINISTEISYNIPSNLEKKKHDDNNKSSTNTSHQQKPTTFGTSMPDPDDDDKFSHFKKDDGSNRYECEKQESPEWKKSQNFKDEFRTNGGTGKNQEYYRWDMKHKDIEVYDNKARYLGSKDPVTGKMYRKGDMLPNDKLRSIIK